MRASRMLRSARRASGLTQRRLALAAGVPQSTVARIETGRLAPRSDTLERLLRASGFTLELAPAAGEGVDRSQIHALLRLTPGERARLAAADAAGLARALEPRGERAARPPGRVAVRRPVPFDPLRALQVLDRHGVRFVVIGAFAGRLLGSPTVTRDLDLCYARDPANLASLAAALRELDARLRGTESDEAVSSFRLDAQALRADDQFTFTTAAGDLDILGSPAGTAGYEELARTAEELDLDGLRIRVASIDSLIRMKRAAGRPKDLIEAEVLSALRDELDREARDR